MTACKDNDKTEEMIEIKHSTEVKQHNWPLHCIALLFDFGLVSESEQWTDTE